jgi:hypothetical protein
MRKNTMSTNNALELSHTSNEPNDLRNFASVCKDV